MAVIAESRCGNKVDIAAGAEEQSTALQEVNIAVNQMDQATQQNAAMAMASAERSASRGGE